jgi:hypothetical protein
MFLTDPVASLAQFKQQLAREELASKAVQKVKAPK